MVVLTLLSHYGHFHGDWYQTIDTRSHYKHMVIDITLRTQGDWYYICMYTVNIWWLISHYGLIYDWYHTNITFRTNTWRLISLISHYGHIHGERDGGAVRGIPAHVPSVQHLQGSVPLRLADPVVWLQVLSHITREVPLQRHVGGSNCSTQQALGNPPLPQRLHQITWHGQSGDREGFWGTTEGFWGDDGPRGVVSPVVSPVFVEEVKYQGTNQ